MAKAVSTGNAQHDILDVPLNAGAVARPVVRATDLTGVHVLKSGEMFMLNSISVEVLRRTADLDVVVRLQ